MVILGIIGTNKLIDKRVKNKVIRLKSRASAFSKNVRQTDRQTFFFKKTFEMAVYYLLHYKET